MNDLISREDVQKAREDYESTIYALLCLASVLTFDETTRQMFQNAHHSFGRKMTRSNGGEVTPDGVVQRHNQLGYLIEAKKSMPDNQNHWQKLLEQLLSYDDVELGWWTADERMDIACVTLLLHQSRGVAVQEYLDDQTKEKELKFVKPLSIIEFNRSQEAQEYIFLRKRDWGSLEDQTVFDELRHGIQVPLEKVIANGQYGNLKFYDATPVEEHTMLLLWQNIFNPMRNQVELDEDTNSWPLRVNLRDLTSELQKLYGATGEEERDVAFPKRQWVKAALDAFVLIELAEPLADEEYVIYFKHIKTDPIERFSSFRKKAKLKAEDESQLSFLENEGEVLPASDGND